MAIQELIVVRHGETEWNRQLRVQGSTDVPLNDKGVAQAAACANAIKDYFASNKTMAVPSTIYSSPLLRAKHTATAIAKAIGSSDQTSGDSEEPMVSTATALKEWNMGVLEGLNKDQASMDFPDEWRVFGKWADPYVPTEDSTQVISNGESMEQVRWRAVEFIENIVGQHTADGPVVCVTHGALLGQLLRHVAETGPRIGEEEGYAKPGNACISKFSLELSPKQNGETKGSWNITSWADTSHLVGDLAPAAADYDDSKNE